MHMDARGGKDIGINASLISPRVRHFSKSSKKTTEKTDENGEPIGSGNVTNQSTEESKKDDDY